MHRSKKNDFIIFLNKFPEKSQSLGKYGSPAAIYITEFLMVEAGGAPPPPPPVQIGLKKAIIIVVD